MFYKRFINFVIGAKEKFQAVSGFAIDFVLNLAMCLSDFFAFKDQRLSSGITKFSRIISLSIVLSFFIHNISLKQYRETTLYRRHHF